MNIDLSSQTQFNDTEGLKSFFLVHQFVHDQEASALTAKYHIPIGTFAISSDAAVEAWVNVMRQGAQGEKLAQVPTALTDWLKFHADMHTQAYALLGSSPTVAPDLSVADFSREQSFNDWMFVHQQMHDWEYQQLGLT